MGLKFEPKEHDTTLAEEEMEGLLITTIATRAELDEFEQQNIEQAVLWTLQRSFKPDTIFTEAFVQRVHKKMYGRVWAWAGTFRQTNKNIGVDRWQISTALKALLDDSNYWLAHHTYMPDELAIRFKHRLVSIHCFANGNGRHSRLLADIIVSHVFGLPVFTWGSANLVNNSTTRATYIAALKAADSGNIKPLLQFARS